MRVCNHHLKLTSEQTTALYCYDVNDGINIACGKCGHRFITLNDNYEEEHCPHCNTEVMYPGWVSW